MCDSTRLRNWLIGLLAAILAAAGGVVSAAALNGSWWYTYLSPGVMVAAAICTAAAIGCCIMATNELNSLRSCLHEKCAGPIYNMANLLTSAKVTLGIQLIACVTVAGYAWVPTAAQPAMYVIIAALLVQFALIVSGFVFFNNLASCSGSGISS